LGNVTMAYDGAPLSMGPASAGNSIPIGGSGTATLTTGAESPLVAGDTYTLGATIYLQSGGVQGETIVLTAQL